MEQIDTLIHARWVIPIAPQNIVLEHHSLAVHNGKIIDLLPTAQATQQYQANTTQDLTSHALMPGLVNAHAHTPMNLFRGLADDLPLMDWLNHHIWPAEQATINPDSVAAGTRLAIAEMLRGGTTCFNDHYFFPDVIAQTAIAEGIRASVGLVIMSVPTDWAKDEDEYFTKAKATLESDLKHDLIRWVIAPHAPYTVSDSSLEKIARLNDQFSVQVHMHVHETAFEVEQSLTNFSKRPIQRLHDFGLLSPRFINVHMTTITDDEIQLIKTTGAHVVHCPESNLKLASGFCPIGKLLDAGINVAIGTDGAASNNDLDMFGELRTAAMLAKAVSQNPTTLPAEQALAMATINGARALGLDQEIGSLEKGKYADVIAVDLGSYLTQPIYNPMSHLAYAVNRLQVSDVWVAGEQLLQSGEFTQLDVNKALADAQPWITKADEFKSAASTMQTADAN